jgi:carbon starvation protein
MHAPANPGIYYAPLLLDDIFTESIGNRTVLHAMPLLLGALCALAIAYRYYSAFLAAKVAALDDSRVTPAHKFDDGQNYHPTSKWVLFGHHFAAISGAGPLIGPVLAIQYGYMPGLLWLVIGVCLAGAVQDMLVLAASVRRGGKSLAEIARTELGSFAGLVVSAAILFIVVIALAGLGFVVVKALGGEEVKLREGTRIFLPKDSNLELEGDADTTGKRSAHGIYRFPGGCSVESSAGGRRSLRPESFLVQSPPKWLPREDISRSDGNSLVKGPATVPWSEPDEITRHAGFERQIILPAGCAQIIPGSSWGTFTIAATIPIALLVGLYMYRLRPGRVVEASLLGAALTLAAVFAGNWIPGSPWERFFSFTKGHTTFLLCAYGFVASVLPVWLLLLPRDYLSSFLKIGMIALLVIGVFVANPVLPCPPVNHEFLGGGPTFAGGLFPFVFICIMCGAISGFHALVSSGTTPKMIDKESHVRPIGYGAMLMEGLVGIVALIAAASMDPKLYYEINVAQDTKTVEKWQPRIDKMIAELGNADVSHLPVERTDLGKVEELVGGESLRGRTGGAVTLAVGMSFVLTDALHWALDPETIRGLLKYWYHFAIMFEALFILTTIDAGTRIARFLVQEAMGRIHPKLGRTDWMPGAAFATLVVTAGWGLLVYTGSIDTIWPMFGIANQLLAVMALALVTTLLVNTGRGRYATVTLLPMLFVISTTMTAGVNMVGTTFPAMYDAGQKLKATLCIALTVFVMATVGTLLLIAVSRWVAVAGGLTPRESEKIQ